MVLITFIPQSSRRLTGNWREVAGFGKRLAWNFGMIWIVKQMSGSEMCEPSASLISLDAETEHSVM